MSIQNGDKKYIMAIDSGSTGIRAFLYNKSGEIVFREYEKTPSESPSPGAVEHDPVMLWNTLLIVVKKVLRKGNVLPGEIASIGITNQRGSFCLWEKKTGKPVTKFINWADVRAADTTDEMNRNTRWRFLKKAAGIIGRLTGSTMMITTSILSFTTDHATCRLKWVLDNNPELRERCENGEILFGTLDSWFIYNLTGRENHFTDVTNASGTALYNPFELKWNNIYCDLFNIPMKIFPEVLDTNGEFGETDPALFNGSIIPIRSAVGDQMAALFGHRCFSKGDVKVSQGSGAFVDINVGSKGRVSRRGLFPLIAWRLNGETVYMLEGYVATAGTLIDWLGKGIGLSDTPAVLNEFASRCEDTEGVVFIPTPSGIRFPYFNPRARGSIIGLSLSTHRKHVARAVLEGISFRILDILEGITKDTGILIKSIKVDGGVSKSKILLQSLSNFANLTIERAAEADMTAAGAAYFAGLAVGFWKDLDELRKLNTEYSSFVPSMDPEKRKEKIIRWKKAVNAVNSID